MADDARERQQRFAAGGARSSGHYGRPVTDRRRRLGALGEEIAACRLASDGARVIARNARTRFGEIDLIVHDKRALVFVEVKTLRSGAVSGPACPAHSVGHKKRARLRRLAAAWLSENRALPYYSDLRFDVIGIRLDPTGKPTEYEHIRGAF